MGTLTGVSDVEPSASRGVIRLKFQADHVPAAGQLGGHIIAGKCPEDSDVRNAVILDGEEVELWLHVEVVKDEVNPGSRLGEDQPHAVHVVPILLGVIGGQDDPR